MNTFKCNKCSKDTEYYGSVIFPDFIEYQFCNDCGNILDKILNEKRKEAFKEFIQPERLSPGTPKGEAIV